MMDKNSDEMERIGEAVMASKERHQEYILKMTPEWKKVGEKLRKARESLHISRREVSELIGASVSVLVRLENGQPIRRRCVVETSYRSMLHFIPMRRRMEAGLE